MGKLITSYQGICLPYELLILIDKNIKGLGYISRTDFIKQSIRNELRRIGPLISKNKGGS